MSRTHHIDDALRSLDAADHPTDPGSTRPTADLERILASGISPAPHQAWSAGIGLQSGTARIGRPARRAGLAAAVLAAATAGVIALPPLSGGDQAFASWTPNPEAIPPIGRQQAAADCRDAQEEHSYDAQLAAAETAIAERRGVWTTVVLVGQDGFTALCITDESRPFYARGMIGHIGMPIEWTPPGARDLTATSLGYGVVDNGELSLAAGFAGSDITGIVYRSPAHGDVTASLSKGHFALWLPGAELKGASRDGVRLEVSYRDGSTADYTITL